MSKTKLSDVGNALVTQAKDIADRLYGIGGGHDQNEIVRGLADGEVLIDRIRRGLDIERPERSELVDALDHIARVCRASRTQTRRIRWIEARARNAVEGGEDWRELDVPSQDPVIGGYRAMLELVYPFVMKRLADLRTQRRHGATRRDLVEEIDALEKLRGKVRQYYFNLWKRYDVAELTEDLES